MSRSSVRLSARLPCALFAKRGDVSSEQGTHCNRDFLCGSDDQARRDVPSVLVSFILGDMSLVHFDETLTEELLSLRRIRGVYFSAPTYLVSDSIAVGVRLLLSELSMLSGRLSSKTDVTGSGSKMSFKGKRRCF